MPIVRRHNSRMLRFEAELEYSDLVSTIIQCCIFYGTGQAEFFFDLNNPVIKTLVSSQDPRLFEILADINQEMKLLLQEQLQEEALQLAEIQEMNEKRISLRSSKPGYVYLVQAEKYFKIGHSKQPDIRFSQIGLQLPFPFEVLHVIPVSDMYEAEKLLHTKYEHQHLNGEWFSLSPVEVTEIMRIESL